MTKDETIKAYELFMKVKEEEIQGQTLIRYDKTIGDFLRQGDFSLSNIHEYSKVSIRSVHMKAFYEFCLSRGYDAIEEHKAVFRPKNPQLWADVPDLARWQVIQLVQSTRTKNMSSLLRQISILYFCWFCRSVTECSKFTWINFKTMIPYYNDIPIEYKGIIEEFEDSYMPYDNYVVTTSPNSITNIIRIRSRQLFDISCSARDLRIIRIKELVKQNIPLEQLAHQTGYSLNTLEAIRVFLQKTEKNNDE